MGLKVEGRGWVFQQRDEVRWWRWGGGFPGSILLTSRASCCPLLRAQTPGPCQMPSAPHLFQEAVH